MNKPEIIRVKLSSTFMVRTKCTHCMGGPTYYYYLRNPTMWMNPRKSMDQRGFLTALLKSLGAHHMYDEPRFYTSASMLAHDVMYAKYRPRLHRTRGSSAGQDLVECLTCDCMKTCWYFANKAVAKRPEIVNRKSDRYYPNKFEF